MQRRQLFLCAICLGCSAIIEPDIDRLGVDAGGSPFDAGGGGSDDAGRMCPPSCDDGVPCTTDACVDFACVSTPDDAQCGGGERCSPVLGCVPEVCRNDQECDDGSFCNGAERCVEGAPGTGCVSGDLVVCPEDDAACSTAFCDEALGACSFMLDDGACGDGVDCTQDRCEAGTGCVHEPDDGACGGDFCRTDATCDPETGCTDGVPRDCDDMSPCTDDSCDDALAMCVNELRDDDGDGAFVRSISPPGGPPVMCGGTDCDDMDMNVNPAEPEHCNRIDDNCDGRVDEGCPVAVPGDDCGSPTLISLVASTSMTVTGSLGGFADNYRTNAYCESGSGGRDAVYAIELPNGLFDVTIDTVGSAADTVLGVGFECGATAFGGVCNDDIDSSTSMRASRIWVHRFGSNTMRTRIYVLVDGFDSSATGNFTLTVRRSAAAPDTCPSGTGGALPLDISGGGALVGFNASSASTQSGSCSPIVDLGSEAIFRVRRPTSGNVNFEIFSNNFTPDAYLRRSPGCTSGTEIGCENGAAVGGGFNGVILRRSVNTELHYLFVDGGPGTYAVYYEPF